MQLKVRLNNLLDKFREDGSVTVSTDQAVLLLEAAARESEEMLDLLAGLLAREDERLIKQAKFKVELPEGMSVEYSSWAKWSRSNLERLGKRVPVKLPPKYSAELPRSLALRLARHVREQASEELPRLPVSLLADLELSRDEVSSLLGRAEPRQQRQRLIQLMGRHSEPNNPASERRP